MLILERREGEGIVLTLGKARIDIIVAMADHGKSKIHLEAPEEVMILRNELIDEMD